jgi:ATP synthase protein I
VTDKPRDKEPRFSSEVGQQANRKIRGKRDPAPGVWFGLGMMGLVGWSVTVPTLIGAAVGLWLDKHHPATYSWTLALMVAGLTLGCFSAWRWIARERDEIGKKHDDP